MWPGRALPPASPRPSAWHRHDGGDGQEQHPEGPLLPEGKKGVPRRHSPQGQHQQTQGRAPLIYLGLTLTILPLFIVYFALSKYIIAGVALGRVKG